MQIDNVKPEVTSTALRLQLNGIDKIRGVDWRMFGVKNYIAQRIAQGHWTVKHSRDESNEWPPHTWTEADTYLHANCSITLVSA